MKNVLSKIILGMTLVSLASCGVSASSSSEEKSSLTSSSEVSSESLSKDSSLSSKVESSSSKSSSSDKPSSSSSQKPSSSSSKVTSSSTNPMSYEYDKEEVLTCGHHTEISTVTNATCKYSGYTMHICLTCGAHKKDTTVSATSCKYTYVCADTSSQNQWGGNSGQLYVRTLCETCGSAQSGSSISKSSAKVALNSADNIDTTGYVGVVANEQGSYRAYPRLGYEFVGWSTGETNDTLSSYSSDTVAIFKYKQTELPIISIDLENNTRLSSIERVEYVGATYTVISGEKTEVLPGQFKGRGNGSWVGGNGKSGYTIKLDKKKQLIGMDAKEKKWSLIACKDDPTLHINQSAYYIAKNALDGIEWQVQTKYTEVFVNKEFRGVYMLTDAIQAKTDRVNVVTEDANGDYDFSHQNPGFLIEYDKYATSKQTNLAIEPSPRDGYTYFKVDGIYRPFSVKYPDPDDSIMYGGTIANETFTGAVKYIKDYMQEYANAINSNDYTQIESKVVMESMADMYLVHELFKNSDVGWSSFYLYKKPNEDKLRYGPAWDFDLAATKAREVTTSGCFISTKNSSQDPNTSASANYNDMFVKAIKTLDSEGKRGFKELLLSRYKLAFSRILQGICDTTNGYDNASTAFALNSRKWNQLTRANDISSLYTWLLNRAEWMINNDFVG